MNVLGEILRWSESRPDWQRDALRRLVKNGDLEDADLEALTEICKGTHGLAEDQEHTPLEKEHLPTNGTDTGQVNVQSIYHHCGVNALAADQTLKFEPGLTVVYGDNAAGKSGYTRILKSACRARGSEDIMGNVLSETAPPTVSVEIKYTVGSDGGQQTWTGNGEDESIGRVSVFDSHSASVYLKEKRMSRFGHLGWICSTSCQKRAKPSGKISNAKGGYWVPAHCRLWIWRKVRQQQNWWRDCLP